MNGPATAAPTVPAAGPRVAPVATPPVPPAATAAVPRWTPTVSAMNPFGRLAALYDCQLPLERRALRATVGMLAVAPSDRLLDLGTGTGAALREVERLPVRPARTVGVDASERMLARARAVLTPGTELVAADARALPLADATFDVAVCAYLLHVMPSPDRAEAIRELRRVLAPGGRLGVVTVAPPGGRLARLASLPARAAAERSTGVLAGLRPLDPRGELRAAGLEPRTARRTSLGYPSLCVVARRAG